VNEERDYHLNTELHNMPCIKKEQDKIVIAFKLH